MDVDTNASMCFGIVSVRRATTHEEHSEVEGQKMTVLEQTAFVHSIVHEHAYERVRVRVDNIASCITATPIMRLARTQRFHAILTRRLFF